MKLALISWALLVTYIFYLANICCLNCLFFFSEKVEDHLRAANKKFQISRLLILDSLRGSNADPDHCVCNTDYNNGLCSFCYAQYRKTGIKNLQNLTSNIYVQQQASLESENNSLCVFNNRVIRLPSRAKLDSNINFIYIGRKGSTFTAMSLKWPSCTFHIVNPTSGEVESTCATKMAMQRNYKVEQIRDAEQICLLIREIIPNLQLIIDKFRKLIKNSGKKSTIIFMDHPDLTKLKNYPNVDVFVYISCPESTIVERNADPDLYKIISSPWELELALNENREWNLSFESDCQQLVGNDLPDSSCTQSKSSVSLINNKFQNVGLREEVITVTPLDSSTGALCNTSPKQLEKIIEDHRRGLLWGDSRWYGLNPDEQSAVPAGIVVEGRRGVAAGYANENS